MAYETTRERSIRVITSVLDEKRKLGYSGLFPGLKAACPFQSRPQKKIWNDELYRLVTEERQRCDLNLNL